MQVDWEGAEHSDHLVTGQVRFILRNFYISSAVQQWGRPEPAVDVGGELDTTVQLLDMPTHNLAHVLFMISFDYPDRI